MGKILSVAMAFGFSLLLLSGSAMGDIFGPAECASTLDPGRCCDRAADETTRVETARAILRVNKQTYRTVINYWAVKGSGEDGVGEDGAVYEETTLRNFTRQEMWEYLNVVFQWSSDMELVTLDELWETHPDGSMTYMVVNKWFGSTMGGYYEQPGISIVKFRPGEGCAAYQRDYFSEGDTWWGMSFSRDMVRAKRETVITELGLGQRCVDDDGDGYTKYLAATGCPNEGLDCDDYHAAVNPAATEIPGNGFDDDCDPATSDFLLWGATSASIVDLRSKKYSEIANSILLLCLPLGAAVGLRRIRRRG